jgi:hypothetical protein
MNRFDDIRDHLKINCIVMLIELCGCAILYALDRPALSLLIGGLFLTSLVAFSIHLHWWCKAKWN